MSIRTLNLDLQRIAEEELNEDSRRISDDLKHIREWLTKQPHLNIRPDDQLLVNFLRGCKWSLQRAKEKIDYFYTMRSLIPEFFEDRDPFSSDVQKVLDAGIFFPLPKTKDTGSPRICFHRYHTIDSDEINWNAISKVIFMTLDILLKEDDNFVVSGLMLFIEYHQIPFYIVVQVTPSIAKKVMFMIERAYPVRVKQFIGINTPSIVNALYNNICKHIFSEKLNSRVMLCGTSDLNKAHDKLGKSVLPKEYGGDNDSVEDLARQWKTKVESYRNWFLEDQRYGCNEKLRTGKHKTYNEELGMEGSFRKLIID